MSKIPPQVVKAFGDYADAMREMLLAAEAALINDDLDTACKLMGELTKSIARRSVDMENYRVKLKGPVES